MRSYLLIIVVLIFAAINCRAEDSHAENSATNSVSTKQPKSRTIVIKNLSDAKQFRKMEDLDSDMRARPTFELLNDDGIDKSEQKTSKTYIARGNNISSKTETTKKR